MASIAYRSIFLGFTRRIVGGESNMEILQSRSMSTSDALASTLGGEIGCPDGEHVLTKGETVGVLPRLSLSEVPEIDEAGAIGSNITEEPARFHQKIGARLAFGLMALVGATLLFCMVGAFTPAWPNVRDATILILSPLMPILGMAAVSYYTSAPPRR